jgi:predicted phage tail protein
VGKAVDLLPSPQFADMPVRAGASGAQFALTTVQGAQAYHVQIATDQDAQNLIAETRGGTRLAIDGLANGNYYARISAIDKLGLEGKASIYAFNLATAVQSQLNGPAAPYVDRSNSRQVFLKWAGAPGQKFMVQVARDPAFSWLVYSIKTDTAEARVPRPAFGTYYARVQSLNADGSTGPYSAAQAFIVTDEWVMNDGMPNGAKQAR